MTPTTHDGTPNTSGEAPHPEGATPPTCAPLCAASKAYGRFDKPWHHEPECPVRIAWEAERGKP